LYTPVTCQEVRFVHYPLESFSELDRTSSNAPCKCRCRFHYAKFDAEVHKCGPSNTTEFYDELRWVSTSAVESVNSFLKRFRTLGWYSRLESFMVFLPILLSGYNVDLKRVDDAKLAVAVQARQWSDAIRAMLLK
jgi:hypothetical protein